MIFLFLALVSGVHGESPPSYNVSAITGYASYEKCNTIFFIELSSNPEDSFHLGAIVNITGFSGTYTTSGSNSQTIDMTIFNEENEIIGMSSGLFLSLEFETTENITNSCVDWLVDNTYNIGNAKITFLYNSSTTPAPTYQLNSNPPPPAQPNHKIHFTSKQNNENDNIIFISLGVVLGICVISICIFVIHYMR